MFRWGGDFSDMKLLITRTMPDRVLAAAKARFDVTLRATESGVLSPDELRASLRDYDVVMPTLGDRYLADVFADVPMPQLNGGASWANDHLC